MVSICVVAIDEVGCLRRFMSDLRHGTLGGFTQACLHILTDVLCNLSYRSVLLRPGPNPSWFSCVPMVCNYLGVEMHYCCLRTLVPGQLGVVSSASIISLLYFVCRVKTACFLPTKTVGVHFQLYINIRILGPEFV